MTSAHEDAALLARAVEAAREAGAIAQSFFRPGAKTSANVEFKEGNSPVTEADLLVDRFLRARLTDLAPDAGWLSEETADTEDRLSRQRVWIVDPIDGTRAFMAGDPRWCVSAALIEAGKPVLGVIYLPALGAVYAASAGRGATRDGLPIAANPEPGADGDLIAGPPGLLKLIAAAGYAFRTEPRIPSLAYRLVRVADGGLDAGIASTNARDWDIAAADIILSEAGAGLRDIHGEDVVYNQADTRHGVLLAAPILRIGDLAIAARRALASRASG